MQWHYLIRNATVLSEHGTWLHGQSIALIENKIDWIGHDSELTTDNIVSAKEVILADNAFITPGLIDCHTHCVYAGNRADEFKQRLQGISYSEIAQRGGGIKSTVKHTRQVSIEELYNQSLPRVKAMIAQGVSTLEIKSGYGLDLSTEEKMLRVARQLGQDLDIRVINTFLGAHAVPLEYQSKADKYIDYVCEEMLPSLHQSGLVDAVDVFCETIGFTLKQTEKVFIKANELELPIKCHAEQLSNMGAANLAAKHRALSCEHLEFADEGSVKKMAQYDTVAVLLPGAYYFLQETVKPPVELFRQHGVAMAIATDCNPGSSPTTSLLLMLNMACTLFGFTVQEALSAVTTHAAKALGLAENVGKIAVGYQADLVLWDIKDGADLCYQFGFNPLKQQWINGILR